MRSSQRGLTIIELAVTMTVMALLIFSAAPSIGAWMDNTRIRNAADALQSGLQLARSEAIRRNERISLWLVSTNTPSAMSGDCLLSSTSASWVVSVDSPIQHCTDAPSTTSAPKIVTTRAIGDSGGGVATTALQADGSTAANRVTFDGFGRIVNADAIARIDITGARTGGTYRALRVAIAPSGMVRMCDPAVSNANDPRKC